MYQTSNEEYESKAYYGKETQKKLDLCYSNKIYASHHPR